MFRVRESRWTLRVQWNDVIHGMFVRITAHFTRVPLTLIEHPHPQPLSRGERGARQLIVRRASG